MSIVTESQATGNPEQKKNSTENALINANGEYKNAAFEALEKVQAIQAANESAPPEGANLNLPEEQDKPSAPSGAWFFNQGKSCLKWNWDDKNHQGKHLPPGFYQYEQIEAATEEKPARYDWKYICPPWRVIGTGRDNEGNEWYFFEIKDPDKGLTYEARLLSGFWEDQNGWKVLVSKGVRFAPGFSSKIQRHRLLEAMRMSNNSNIFDKRDIIIPTQTGWQPGGYKAYIFPDGEVIGENADRYRVPENIKRQRRFGVAGTPDTWKQNVAPLLNCPMGHLIICMGFAAPFVQTRDNLAGVLIYGDSNIGKTLLAASYVSIYGDASEAGNCAILKARTTEYALELNAVSARNNVLVIDEMAQMKGNVFENIAYMLANGTTKGRGKGQDRELERERQINVLCLLTAERSMTNLAAMRRVPWDTGSVRRVPSVLFNPTLPSCWLSGEWKDELSQAITDNYGAVGRLWLTSMMRKLKDNPQYVKQLAANELSHWQSRFTGVSGQALKVMKAFSLLCALGCAAYSLHGLNENDIRASMFQIFEGIRDEFGDGNRNVKMAVEHLRGALEAARADHDIVTGEVPAAHDGWWKKVVIDGVSFVEYHIIRDRFRVDSKFRWDGNSHEAVFEWLLQAGVTMRDKRNANRNGGRGRDTHRKHGCECYIFRFPDDDDDDE